MQRVLIIGISGAGKSTLARALAARTHLPLIHLDREFWQPGWVMTKRDIWRPKVEALAAGERWIMDGNYGGSLDLRLPRADTVIWFDYPRLKCLRRALWRGFTSRGRVRPDLAAGCPEKFDADFYRYIWGFNGLERNGIIRALREHGGHLQPVIFRHDGDARAFLASLGPQSTADRV
jgi:adenylate kinase family enzyme